MIRENIGSLFTFIRDKDVIRRRERINEFRRQVEKRPRRHRFNITELREMLSNAGLCLSRDTLTYWCQMGLVSAFKMSKKKGAKWWMTANQLLNFSEKMSEMSDTLEAYREAVRNEPRYIIERDLPPRDSRGRFRKKEKTVDHREMYGRLG